MVRPTRTVADLKSEIALCVARYTVARTDWEGERRDAKKIALRKAARLVRQLCERGGHRIGLAMELARDVPPTEVVPAGWDRKCPVCDTSGEVKREANVGTEEYQKRAALAYDQATGKAAPPPPASGLLMACGKCGAKMSPKFLSADGFCGEC